MSTRRDLKKDINSMVFQVVSECFSLMDYSPELNQESISNILLEAIELRNELAFSVNHYNNLKSRREVRDLFKKIIADLFEKNVEFIERLNNLKA